jgi:hypothetical protein
LGEAIMKAFGGAGVGRPETAAERRARRKREAENLRTRVGALDDDAKTAVLAHAIVDAVEKRGTFATIDGMQAGLSEADTKRLYDGAVVVARAADPALMQGVRP